jgi:hypothetical protein
MKHFDLFDAVRIVGLPEGRTEIPAYYSQTGTTHIKLGDIGVILAEWPNNKYRVEAVRVDGAIDWQDHCFEREHLEVLPATAANFCRRRINEHWAYQLSLGNELLDNKKRKEPLKFARKVMAFARRNVELLIERLQRSGYQFANPNGPRRAPDEDMESTVDGLAARGVYVPVALQAWFMEVGGVDLSGTHPEWPRSAYSGMGDDRSGREPWYTDPLFIWYDARNLLTWLEKRDRPTKTRWLELAPDSVTKANISGGGPVSINCESPLFDTFLVGQHGSFTLLSYLRSAFDWSGFPGFEYIPDAPKEMLRELGRGLTRL